MPPLSHPKNFGRGKPAVAIDARTRLEVRLSMYERELKYLRKARKEAQKELDQLDASGH